MDRDTAEPTVASVPGARATEWLEHHRDVAALSTHVYPFVWAFADDAIGPFCTDVDGNVLLDFASHVASAPLGYNNPALLERLDAVDLVDPLKIAGQDFYVTGGPDHSSIPGPLELMERLVDWSDHYGLDTVFLSNSGAEAVENALKICYDATGGEYGITFEGAFHGRTLGALSINRSKAKYRRGFPEIAGIHDVPFCRDGECSPETCDCGFFRGETSQLRHMLDPERGYVDANDVAYVILEPVQGEGGYYVPSDAFMNELASLQDEYGLTIIADEIQSGLGRSGETWAIDHWPVEPDVIASAKGLRVGATIASDDVFPREKGRLSSTWGGGDVLSSAVGAMTMDVIDEQNLRANARKRGESLRDQLRALDADVVESVRGLGLLIGVEFDTKQRRDDVLDAAFKRGLLTLPAGHKTIRLLPPLDVTAREIRLGVDLFREAILAS